MTNSPLLPWAYDNRIVEPLIGRGGGGGGRTVVNNSPLLLSAYDNRIVEHFIGGVGGEQGRIIVPSLLGHIITRW